MCTFVQFIFLGVRLDEAVEWNWAVRINLFAVLKKTFMCIVLFQIVFIPFWLLYISFIVVVIIVLIATLLSYAVGEDHDAREERKLPDIIYFVSIGFFTLFIIVFMVLGI